MIFGKKKNEPVFSLDPVSSDPVTSVIGPGFNWHGDLRGSGGVRIEGTLEGEVAVRGLVVIGESGKLVCQLLQAETVVVAGAVQGNIQCSRLEIRSTGRIWGDVVTTAFSSEDGAFLRGQMRMEDRVKVPTEATITPAQVAAVEDAPISGITGDEPLPGPITPEAEEDGGG